KPGREMARWKFHRLAIGDLALGKNPLHKTLTKTIDRVLNALDLDHVHANAEHAHDKFFVWGAHAPRVLIAAPRRNASKRKVSDGEGAIASTRGACAPQILNTLTRCNSPSARAFRARRFPSPQKLRVRQWH